MVVLLVPLLAGLGNWQLQRAAEKQSILAQRARAELDKGVDISGYELVDELHLRKVIARCELDGQNQLLLDNRIFRQRVGYEVLAPCKLNDDITVLINRGWVGAGPSREQLPDVSIVASIPKLFPGHFAIPGVGFNLGDAITPTDAGWPRRVQFYDYEAIGRLLSASLMPGVLYLDRDSPLALTYSWQPIAFGPEKNYGYAFQWFALMTTLLVFYVIVNTRRYNRN